MSYKEDAEIIRDKELVRRHKATFDAIIVNANSYIDKIVSARYGDLTKYSSQTTELIAQMEALKLKYPIASSEIDAYITQANNEIDAVKTKWDTEVYNKIQV